MNGKNSTLVSVFYEDQILFTTDAFPVIPEVGEVISIRELDERGNASSTRYIVTSRDYIFEKNHSRTNKDIYVIIRVRKTSFED